MRQFASRCAERRLSLDFAEVRSSSTNALISCVSHHSRCGESGGKVTHVYGKGGSHTSRQIAKNVHAVSESGGCLESDVSNLVE